MKLIKKIFVILIVISLTACIADKKGEKIERMFFAYDSTLVGKTVSIDPGILFELPLGMEEITDKLPADQFAQNIPFNFNTEKLRIFFHVQTMGTLLTTVSKDDITVIQNDILSNTPIKLISDDTFYKDDILICQYIYGDNNSLMLIFLLPMPDSVIEMIYLIPKEVYPEFAKKIESSLGSIKYGG